jgi:ribulose-phosphate 3-epimerase
MSVNPGFGGQKFIASTLPKLREVRRRIDAWRSQGGQEIWLEVDGGVKVDNIAEVAAAGADTFVAGSAVFGARDPDGGYRGVFGRFREALAGV